MFVIFHFKKQNNQPKKKKKHQFQKSGSTLMSKSQLWAQLCGPEEELLCWAPAGCQVLCYTLSNSFYPLREPSEG